MPHTRLGFARDHLLTITVASRGATASMHAWCECGWSGGLHPGLYPARQAARHEYALHMLAVAAEQ
jgi:hypothetical protein